MSFDLYIAMAVMLGVSAGLFVAIVWLGRRRNGAWVGAVGVAGAIGLVVHAVFLNDNPTMTRIVPLANMIVWANWTPIFTAMLAGAAWVKMAGPKWQRVLACTALLGICLYRAYGPLAGSPPALRPDRWTSGVCRQSTTSTCSAAAAATLLAQHGIATTEAEMTQLCLTRPRGTTTFGIYRGLKLKSNRAVVVVELSMDELMAMKVPAMISIGLPSNDPGGIGLAVGNSHSVVMFGENGDGTIDVGDPFAGRQKWTKDQLRRSWHGEAFVVR